jgi:ABC-2 type transport system ATP-binding protein
LIEISGLVKNFGPVAAIKGLDLKVERGEVFGFLGPNGAGKTTAVKIITGLLKPTAGKILVCGFDVAVDPLEAKKRMGLVPDEPFVYPKLTGFEFMRFVGELYDVPVERQRKRIPELLEMFELKDRGGEVIESYSHGMRQKLVWASVILHEPQVLVLDEPLVGLDPKSARMVKEIIFELSKRGTSVFMCTHVLEIAEKICGRIGIMQEGSLIACGTLEELRTRSNDRRSLEDLFLSLTGGQEYAALLRNL